MPIISGGGGGGTPFNGGTITNPQTIDVGSLATAGGLTIQGTAGSNVTRLLINFLHTLFRVTGDGLFDVESDDALGVSFVANGDTGSSLLVANNPTATNAVVEANTSRASMVVFDAADVPRAALWTDRGVVTAVNAAPDDSLIAAGQAALWFDQTNGAAKLMVKAKQADGTVRSAAIALT
jgi:hypothetical protein